MRLASFLRNPRSAGPVSAYVAGEEPLRAELLNAEQMEERGRELSQEHEARPSLVTANPLLQRCQPFKRDVRQRTLWTAASASSNCLVPIT